MSEQEERLSTLLAANMRRILSDREFFQKLIEQHKVRFPESDGPINGNDMSVGVSRSRYGRRLEDGSWEEGEGMQIGFKQPMGDGMSGTSYVHIANRIDTPDGPQLVVVQPFTQQEGEMTAEMIDELMLAKASGQIPDLHEISLDNIFIPPPRTEDPYY